jgi:hypothetical protein
VHRRIFGSKCEEVTRNGENFIMKSTIICILHQILSRFSNQGDTYWGPPILLSNRYWGAFPPGINCLVMKFKSHLHQNAAIKNAWSYFVTHIYVFMVWYLRKQFYLLLLCSTIGVLGFYSRRDLRIFLFTTASRTALRPTQPPIQCVPGALSLGSKATGAWSWPIISI